MYLVSLFGIGLLYVKIQYTQKITQSPKIPPFGTLTIWLQAMIEGISTKLAVHQVGMLFKDERVSSASLTTIKKKQHKMQIPRKFTTTHENQRHAMFLTNFPIKTKHHKLNSKMHKSNYQEVIKLSLQQVCMSKLAKNVEDEL